jgi:L-alanine-DL-glutamate epimerase-like enolase superfamily enzyme
LKITRVEPFAVAYPEPNDFNATRYLCLVKVTTDSGLHGWGEAITQFAEANPAVAHLIDGLAEVVVGRDPVHSGAIWQAMKDRAWWYGYGGGLASSAIAAIDMAVWDVKGKALDTSVCDLLGGPVHERLPAIASSHGHHESIPAMADEALGWLESGMQGIKVGFGKRGNARLGYDHDRDVEYVSAMRDAIGPERALMIDLGIAIKWDVPTAVRRVQAFDDYAIDWIEEPLGAWHPSGYAELKAKTRAAIAYGEKEWNVEGYERVLATGTCDVVGVDPGRAEGITGFQKIVDRVVAHGRQANAHAWSSAITTAASLAVSFSTASCHLFELKPVDNPMQHELVTRPIRHEAGWMYPPTSQPGLGIEVIDDVVEKYRQPGCARHDEH